MGIQNTPITDKQIDDVLNDVHEQIDEGGSRFRGMSYEEGVAAALHWVTGESDEHPYEDE